MAGILLPSFSVLGSNVQTKLLPGNIFYREVDFVTVIKAHMPIDI